MHIGTQNFKRGLLTLTATTFAAMTFSMLPPASAGPPNPPAPAVITNSVPLSVVTPTTPLVLTNSMSMDSSDNIIDDANSNLSVPAGTTHARVPSSAIMTWSGAAGYWTNSSPGTSPANYQVPAGFMAPVTGATAGSNTAYVASLNSYPISTSGYWGNSGSQCYDWVTVPLSSTDVSIPNPFTNGYPPPTPAGFPGGGAGWGTYQILNGQSSGYLTTVRLNEPRRA